MYFYILRRSKREHTTVSREQDLYCRVFCGKVVVDFSDMSVYLEFNSEISPGNWRHWKVDAGKKEFDSIKSKE